MDHYAPRAYVRLAIVWPFNNSQEVEAVEKMRTGIHCLLNRYPYLAGHLVTLFKTEPVRPGQGLMEIHYPDNIHSVKEPHFVVNHLSKEDFPYTYDELDAEGMPGNKLINGLLTKVPHVPDLGKPQPIVSITANFFQGGLILHTSLLHVAGDGTGMNFILQQWCDFVRNGDSPQTIAPNILDDRRTLIQPNEMKTSDGFPTGYEMVTPKEGPTGINAIRNRGLPHAVGAHTFVFSTERLRLLKDKINEKVGVENEFWVSKNDCINAMLWLYATRARAEDIGDESHTTFFTPVDIRNKVKLRHGPKNFRNYDGNATLLAQVTHPLKELLHPLNELLESSNSPPVEALDTDVNDTPDTPMQGILNDEFAMKFRFAAIESHRDLDILSKLARVLRQSVKKVDDPYIQQRLSFMSTALPQSHLVKWNFRNFFGPDFFCTSWEDFGADAKWRIPGTLSECPTYLRKTYVPDDGSSVVLPRKKGKPAAKVNNNGDVDWIEEPGPYEVWVQLREDHMQKLCAMDSLGGWADRIV